MGIEKKMGIDEGGGEEGMAGESFPA